MGDVAGNFVAPGKGREHNTAPDGPPAADIGQNGGMKRRLGTLTLVAAGALACGHSGAKDGYGGWRTVTTAHFALHTPLSAADAESTALQLERVARAIETTFFRNATLDLIDVLLFDDPQDAERAATEARAAAAGSPSRSGESR